MVLGFLVIFLYNLALSKNLLSFDSFKINYWNKVASFFYHSGYFNTVYNNIFLNLLEVSYISTNKYIDKGILEFFGPYGFYKFFRNISLKTQSVTPTIIFFTVGWMFFFIVFFLSFLFFHFSIFSFLFLNTGLVFLTIALTLLSLI